MSTLFRQLTIYVRTPSSYPIYAGCLGVVVVGCRKTHLAANVHLTTSLHVRACTLYVYSVLALEDSAHYRRHASNSLWD